MREIAVVFPEKISLGNVYSADRSFPHARKWIGEASGNQTFTCADDKMFGVALSNHDSTILRTAFGNGPAALESLDLSTSHFSASTLDWLLSLNGMRELRFDFLKIRDTDLLGLKDLPSLETIWLTGTEVGNSAAESLAQLPALRNLVIKKTRITEEGLARVADIDAIESLYLPAQTSDAGLKALSGAKKLRLLDISFTRVSDQGLAALSAFKELSELYLNDTGIGDAGMAHLAKVDSLRTVFLSGTKVTDNGIVALSELPRLEHLELRDTKVSEIGVARVRAQRPECAIFHM